MYRTFLLLGLICLTACAPRGVISFGNAPKDAIEQLIWVAAFRSTQPPKAGERAPPRPEQMQFSRYVISIPPNHQTGQIEWPTNIPDGNRHFLTTSQTTLPALPQFARQVGQAQRTETILLFVHGYNTTHGEAVYQAAQIAHDFEVQSPVVLFSWPSAGRTVGYLYDRDSVLIARDALQDVILSLSKTSGRKIEILAHSMGGFLVMETLRQIESSKSLDIGNQIKSLTLVSLDIDGELFYAQASALRALPVETTILAARQDHALRWSALLTGRTTRLGSATDRTAVRDLPVTVIDTSDLAEGRSTHAIPFTSARAIALIKALEDQLGRLGTATDRVINLEGER